ncbi:MAG: PD40 domain-containing protein [Ruminococcus sp.]|nr:PD40 domain-containing protein [Ruminococcus sp.]
MIHKRHLNFKLSKQQFSQYVKTYYALFTPDGQKLLFCSRQKSGSVL